MIRKLGPGRWRLYAEKPDRKTGKRRNLGTFDSLAGAKKHEREVEYFVRRAAQKKRGTLTPVMAANRDWA